MENGEEKPWCEPALRNMARADGGSTQVVPVIVGSNNTIQLPVTFNTAQSGPALQKEMSISHLKSIHQEELQRRYSTLFEYASRLGGQRASTNKNFTHPWLTEGVLGPAGHTHEVLEAFHGFNERAEGKTIQLADIFNATPTEQLGTCRPRVVVTRGIAGIGKTACTNWLIHSWVSGSSLTQFDFIFPLPFRELSLLPAGHLYNLTSLLHSYYPYLDCFEQILTSPSRCLFIFDGLDECQFSLDFTSCPEHCSFSEPALPVCLVVNLIRGHLLPCASVWITSRPAALACLPVHCIDRMTEIQGFLDWQKKEFFCRRLGSCGKDIVAQLKKQRTLYNMCYIPAFCWLVAIILERSPVMIEEKCMPQNLTEVYTKFFMLAVVYQHHRGHGSQRSVEDANEVLRSNSATIQNLSRLAYDGLIVQKLVFSRQDLKEYNLERLQLYQGLISEFVAEDNGPFCRKAHSFVHLTVQEYFAALFVLISCSVPNKSSLFSLQIECFGSGCPQALFIAFKKACQEAIKSSSGHLDLFLRFLCGLALECNQRLLQGLLGKVKEKHDVTPQMVKYIHKILETDLSPDRCLNLLYCLKELRDNSLVQKIKDLLATGSLSSCSLSSAEYSALAFVLETSDDNLDVFKLNPYISVPDGLRRLSPVAKLYRRLELLRGTINQEAAECIYNILSSFKTQVTELSFRYIHLDDSVWEKLWTALKSPNCKVKTLSLKNCKLQPRHFKEIGKLLTNSPINELDLNFNYGGDLGVKQLMEGLNSATCSVSKLRIAGNDLSDECCKDLLTFLTSKQSRVHLCLNDNRNIATGLPFLFSGLSHPNCQLKELHLQICGITAKCCEELAANLHSNRSLTKLFLQRNYLEDRGVEQLCSALQQPYSVLHTLQLEGCRLTSRCCGPLAAVLETSRSLSKLSLGWNELGDDGMKVLCRGLQAPGCVLQTLELESCELTAGCCKNLAQVLSSNLSLTTLILTDNDLEDKGVALLSLGLRQPSCALQTLVLQENRLKGACCKDLRQALTSSSSLITLDLSMNLLTDQSVTELQGLAKHCLSLCTIELRLNKFSCQGKRKLKSLECGLKASINL
ncbi:NACHT, LRR and PYD domains-containing protein 3-like isoform X1 [Lepisosteus oculatus]|uniref:NACHT, LRR and PYD domains-containing protein 3-like isoform X1 n=1 Tax=Lepisosteus oculatus TaxID=7918 RepID=UPI00371B4939